MLSAVSARVLIVDDDIDLAMMLKAFLERDGFAVVAMNDGESGVAEALSGDYSIAVLDLMMPGIDGLETLRRIRQKSQMPILMLTGKGDSADRIVGLELGADDYVPKPCMPRELVARIRAILRRSSMPEPGGGVPDALVVGALTMKPALRLAEWNGQPVGLTSTEFNLLEVLAHNAGHPVTKSDLSEKGLGRPLLRFDRSIDVHLSSIRHKLGHLADGRSCVQTLHRQGYQLVKE